MKHFTTRIIATLFTGALCTTASAETKPLKALLITGGCCHDYKTQKDLLKAGIESRINIVVDQIHTDNGSVSPDLPIYKNPDYAKGYDIVIHDECAAGISDEQTVKDVLAPHRDGIPAVNLHCAMHSYRVAGFDEEVKGTGKPGTLWFEFTGLKTTGHGAQTPIEVKYSDKNHAITKGFDNWTTGNEELYVILHTFDTVKPLATGTQNGQEMPVVWTNDYNGTKVFNTTLGHNNETVGDDRYLNLVTRGLLWATGKLNPDGTVAKGYGRQK